MDPATWATVALVVLPAALALAAFSAGWGSRGAVADAQQRLDAATIAALTVERDEWRRRVGDLENDLESQARDARRVVEATRSRALALDDPDDRAAVERLLALRAEGGRRRDPEAPAAPGQPPAAGPS